MSPFPGFPTILARKSTSFLSVSTPPYIRSFSISFLFIPPCFCPQLDQSFTPDGLYAFASDAAQEFDLQSVKDFGLNSIRLHQKARALATAVAGTGAYGLLGRWCV